MWMINPRAGVAGAFFPRRQLADGVVETPAHSVLNYAVWLTQDLCALLNKPTQGNYPVGSSSAVVTSLHNQLDELEAQISSKKTAVRSQFGAFR